MEKAGMDTYAVWRQDDNGIQYCVRTALTYQEAIDLQSALEARGDKQTYFVERTDTLHWSQHGTRKW